MYYVCVIFVFTVIPTLKHYGAMQAKRVNTHMQYMKQCITNCNRLCCHTI